MATQKNKITIIGTGCIGTSIGLALKQSKDAGRLEITAHDREHNRARKGVQAGAFDSAHFNLDIALDKASLVILAVPLADMRQLLEHIGNLIDPTGVVITDTAPLKVPVRQWANEFLPEGVHYVGGTPLLAPANDGWIPLEGPNLARADLFTDAIYAITANANAHPSAVRTVQNLALTLGAVPYFMAAEEHDAVRATVTAVPDIIATAVFNTLYASATWPEARKVAGRKFASTVAASSGNVDSRRMMIQLNKSSVVRELDTIIKELTALRDVVQSNDAEALEKALHGASQERDVWLLQAHERAWEPAPQHTNMQDAGIFDRTMQALLGGALAGTKQTSEE